MYLSGQASDSFNADPRPICPLNFTHTLYSHSSMGGYIIPFPVLIIILPFYRPAFVDRNVRLVSGILEYKLFMPWLTIARNTIRFCRVPLHQGW